MKESVLIIDFGSQVTKLIARRIRELGVLVKLFPTIRFQKKLLTKKILRVLYSLVVQNQ